MPRGERCQRPCSVLPMNHFHWTLTAVLGELVFYLVWLYKSEQ